MPEIAYSVNRYEATDKHMKATNRVQRYLKGTTTHSVTLQKYIVLGLGGFSNSDQVCVPNDRHTTGRYEVYFGEILMS